ncbi:uroporphyrinogen-III synthase [Flavobacterium sp. CBA20B-1]|uniref:uroporphyrinogen-III synthase n=1 Tax=unclassified Flavobacterium TaxID=196869 RepID=UPI00222586A6|nr:MULTISPECIES: uroporphyrinogen-III synthase [unclassified Flavobacterium]WCM43427.1 uroporphyrinogen-III synthase [Flavobacterium sp. CBA20B-1]
MKTKICVLSTKKLQSNQKQFLLNAGFSVIEADFITISFVPFLLKTIPTLLLFTSQNAVKSVLQYEHIENLKEIPAICVGSKTKELLQKNGFEVLETQEYAADLAPIIQQKYSVEQIAFFAGNLRRDVLPNALQQSNIHFEEYLVYQNTANSIEIKAQTDALLFFSPSGIHSYLQQNTIENQTCFCIGTTTAAALNGITNNIVVAKKQTVENVIIQCINYYNDKQNKINNLA